MFIVQLLSEEYAMMSPGTLAHHGLSSHADLSDNSVDSHQKLAGKLTPLLGSIVLSTLVNIALLHQIDHARRMCRLALYFLYMIVKAKFVNIFRSLTI